MDWYPAIVLDPATPLPPYEQIRAQVAAWIASGRLAPGTPLPSVRQLARDLNIAPNTVVRAYEELAHGGWIISAPRKGFVVAVVPATIAEEERRQRLRVAVAYLVSIAWQLGIDAATVHAEIDRQIHGRGAADR
jgi:DNA-binding transcriptional regulator YhcF (GntR family)